MPRKAEIFRQLYTARASPKPPGPSSSLLPAGPGLRLPSLMSFNFCPAAPNFLIFSFALARAKKTGGTSKKIGREGAAGLKIFLPNWQFLGIFAVRFFWYPVRPCVEPTSSGGTLMVGQPAAFFPASPYFSASGEDQPLGGSPSNALAHGTHVVQSDWAINIPCLFVEYRFRTAWQGQMHPLPTISLVPDPSPWGVTDLFWAPDPCRPTVGSARNG